MKMKEFKMRLGHAMPAIVMAWIAISNIAKLSEGVFFIGTLGILAISLWLYITDRLMGLMKKTP